MPSRSLRLWLQSSLLLAVLAGYGLLLLLNQGLAKLQRRTLHQELAGLLAANVQSRLAAGEAWGGLRADVITPGLRLELLAAAPAAPDAAPRLEQRDGRSWMVSRSPLLLPDGRPAELLVRQDVSASVNSQRQAFWLLVAGAGGTSLLTSGLMRLVLRRGLMQPLQRFTGLLDAFQPPPAPPAPIAVAEQPEELRPIALAFNELQARLHDTWQQERTFIDGVAHELRTPLTLISGNAQRLERLLADAGPDSEAAALRQAGQAIHSEAERSGRLVRDLLDLARRDTGRLELQVVPLDAADALLEAFERLEGLAAGRLRLQAPEADADLRVRADPERLGQCLTNLVENALKYAPAPTPVQLAVERRGDTVVLRVRDQGPGVAPAEREAIFQLFHRGAAAPGASSSGSGIGLAMVRLLMERMGGTAQVADAPGGGADFQLLLPALGTV